FGVSASSSKNPTRSRRVVSSEMTSTFFGRSPVNTSAGGPAGAGLVGPVSSAPVSLVPPSSVPVAGVGWLSRDPFGGSDGPPVQASSDRVERSRDDIFVHHHPGTRRMPWVRAGAPQFHGAP